MEFEIPGKTKRKTRHNKATPTEIEGDAKKGELTDGTREDGFDTIYKDLEQEVKEAEPEKVQKTATKKAAAAAAATAAQMTEAEKTEALEMAAAADGDAITKKCADAAEATVASEAQETKTKTKRSWPSYKKGR